MKLTKEQLPSGSGTPWGTIISFRLYSHYRSAVGTRWEMSKKAGFLWTKMFLRTNARRENFFLYEPDPARAFFLLYGGVFPSYSCLLGCWFRAVEIQGADTMWAEYTIFLVLISHLWRFLMPNAQWRCLTMLRTQRSRDKHSNSEYNIAFAM